MKVVGRRSGGGRSMAGGQGRCMAGMPAAVFGWVPVVRLFGCSIGRLRVVRGYAIAEGRSGGAADFGHQGYLISLFRLAPDRLYGCLSPGSARRVSRKRNPDVLYIRMVSGCVLILAYGTVAPALPGRMREGLGWVKIGIMLGGWK